MDDLSFALTSFRRSVVMTIGELTSLRPWSAVTVRRHLRKWGARTSYNHNGRYYVPGDIPRFDTHGLWNYRGVRFSKFGNLTRTIINIAGASESGLNASELSRLLGYEAHPVLARLSGKGALNRERHHGRYVYFSADAAVFQAQKKARENMDSFPCGELSAEGAIVLLVEKIKHPACEVSELSGRLRRRGFQVGVGAATAFLERHRLLKKT